MSRPHDKLAARTMGAGLTRKSGRAVFDDHGRTSWEWQTSTGVFERHITDDQLLALEAPDLQLADANAPQAGDDLWSYRLRRA